MHAAGDGEVGVDVSKQNCSPVKTEQQLVWAAEGEPRDNGEVVNVEVGLIEAIEENKSVDAGFDKLRGEIGDAAELRRQFDRDGNLDRGTDLADKFDQLLLNFAA